MRIRSQMNSSTFSEATGRVIWVRQEFQHDLREAFPEMRGKGRRVVTATPRSAMGQMRNTHPEQMFSALHPKADLSQTSRHDRFVPYPEVGGPQKLSDSP